MTPDENKLKIMNKREKIEELITFIKKEIRSKQNHIDNIKKEGLSVVEYSLNKEDLPRLIEESKDLEEGA